MSKVLVIDCETTGLKAHRDKLHGIGVRFPDGRTRYFLHSEVTPEKGEMVDLLRDEDVVKVGHNVTFDLKFIVQSGYEVRGPVACTRTMAHALDENNSTALDELTERYLGPDRLVAYEEMLGVLKENGCKHVGVLCALDLASSNRQWAKLIGDYCLEDVANTWDLLGVLGKKLKQKDEVLKRLFPKSKGMRRYLMDDAFPFLSAQVAMELKGVKVDEKRVALANKEYTDKIEATEDKLNYLMEAPGDKLSHQDKVCNIMREREFQKRLKKSKQPAEYMKRHSPSELFMEFSWDKPTHLTTLLFEVLRVSTKGLGKTKTGVSLNEENLVKVAAQNSGAVRDMVNLLLERRTQSKLRTTYVGEVGKKGLLKHVDPANSFVYPEYSTFLTTRRLSCHDPNMQNTPRKSLVRGFFVPDSKEYCWVHADASQLELRIAAHLSRDPYMVQAYEDDLDLHVQTAAAMLGIDEAKLLAAVEKGDPTAKDNRQVGKTSNFLLIFFGSAYRLQAQLKNEARKDYTVEQCQELINAYFVRYRKYRSYLDQELERMLRYRVVVSESGCVRRLPDLQLGQWLSYRNREFTGPKELRELLQADVDARRVPQPVLDVPEDEQLYKYASMRFGHAKKQGFNFKVQHLGAVVTKRSIVALTKAGFDVRCTVHDSIDVMVKRKKVLDERARIQAILESSYKLSVPLRWDVKTLNSFNEEDKYDPESNSRGRKTVRKPVPSEGKRSGKRH